MCGSGSLRRVCQRTDKFLLLTEKFRKIVAKGCGKCYDNRDHILQGSHILTVQYIETMRSGVLWAVVSSKSSVRGTLFFFIERADFCGIPGHWN